MNCTIQVRVDPKTKQAVTRIFKKLGFDLSTGIKMYLEAVIRCNGIPFPLLAGKKSTRTSGKEVKTRSQLFE